jgi:hypothetical protein
VTGNGNFQPTADCPFGTGSITVSNPCLEAGAPDAAPDGAGAPCTASAECPAGYACGFSTAFPCAARGSCVFANLAHDPSCAPTTYCACDGTGTPACTDRYALKPVPTTGRQPVCGDGG